MIGFGIEGRVLFAFVKLIEFSWFDNNYGCFRMIVSEPSRLLKFVIEQKLLVLFTEANFQVINETFGANKFNQFELFFTIKSFVITKF